MVTKLKYIKTMTSARVKSTSRGESRTRETREEEAVVEEW
jgi:hypothetical protein